MRIRIILLLFAAFAATRELPLFAQSPGASSHWSFQPPRRSALPAVQRTTWCRNAIDHFILARLEREGVAPAAEADPTTLLRRLSFDLIGLPPSPEEIDAFLADREPGAYERQVDRLLASPHYGERWGRHWLDLTRYADSDGYSIDAPRSMWPYRDWVIQALNRDMPFDRFVIEQMAGDLLPNATDATHVATGFHASAPINREAGIAAEQVHAETIIDRVNTTGAVFLGLTVECARCHDHRYDPISQREYFQLYAFFNTSEARPRSLPTSADRGEQRRLQQAEKALQREFLRQAMFSTGAVAAWESTLTPAARAPLPEPVRQALSWPTANRTRAEQHLVAAAFLRVVEVEEVTAALTALTPLMTAGRFRHAHALADAERTLQALRERQPNAPTSLVLAERRPPPVTRIHLGGDRTTPGEEVAPDVPAVLPPLPADAPHDRRALARWLVDPDHPLTARVLVNRVWEQYFGRGLVESESDFGRRGAPPSHPELLDWLAWDLIESGWSLKALHRLIVTSSTYRQSSRIADCAWPIADSQGRSSRPELADPENRLLHRQNRLRLEAEVIRDAALAASGQFCRRIGGPSVFPPQPRDAVTFTNVPNPWPTSFGDDRYRRGLYTCSYRSTPHPSLLVLDAPSGATTCTRRNRSVTPMQALTLLNDEAFVELAGCVAAQVLREGPGDDVGRLQWAFRRCLGRVPTAQEEASLIQFVRNQGAEFEADPELAQALAPTPPEAEVNAATLATWTLLARALMNLDEFITRE
jgi:hypothetical protein